MKIQRRFVQRGILLLTFQFCNANVAETQPRGRGAPSYQRRLVEEFDLDNDGRVEGAERANALKWIRDERKKNPPRRRGSGGRPQTSLQSRRISRSDVEVYPEGDLYDVNAIRTIFLDFELPLWAEEMALLWRTGISTSATLTMDGAEYPNVGVRFRGTSSFFTILNRKKKSFAISLDWANPQQKVKGYKSLNLLNGHADPTFMRTVLFSHIAGKYVAICKASFVHLVINGESWGLYINDQQINKQFTKEAFGTKGGARWKIPPNFQGQAALAYQGPRAEDYEGKYQLGFSKSKAQAWRGLIKLCDVLSRSTPGELEKKLPLLLDVEHALWFLALDNVLMDGDGYHYRGSDYAIYMNPDGQFFPLFRDNNEAFSYTGGPGGFGRSDPFRHGKKTLTLDPLVHIDEERAALCKALLSVPGWRRQYLDRCRALVNDWLDWKKVGPLVTAWQQQIEPLIKTDDKALYGHQAFLVGLAEGTEGRPGLKKFFRERRAFLLECEALKKRN